MAIMMQKPEILYRASAQFFPSPFLPAIQNEVSVLVNEHVFWCTYGNPSIVWRCGRWYLAGPMSMSTLWYQPCWNWRWLMGRDNCGHWHGTTWSTTWCCQDQHCFSALENRKKKLVVFLVPFSEISEVWDFQIDLKGTCSLVLVQSPSHLLFLWPSFRGGWKLFAFTLRKKKAGSHLGHRAVLTHYSYQTKVSNHTCCSIG